jgi:hypothetical protein
MPTHDTRLITVLIIDHYKHGVTPSCRLVRRDVDDDTRRPLALEIEPQAALARDDDAIAPCSIHCAALSPGLNLDLGPKAIYGADAGSTRPVPPLVQVEQLQYVIDPSRAGAMTRRRKWAYADTKIAQEAANGTGELADFEQALRAAYSDMAEDTILIRKRRAELRG